MSIYLEKRWSSKDSRDEKKLNRNDEINYHLVAFENLDLIKGRLLCHTYADGPIHGIAGFPDAQVAKREPLVELHSSIISEICETSWYDERSVWSTVWKGRGIIM